MHDGGDRMHRMQGRDGNEFDQVDCAGAGTARGVRAEPEAGFGDFGRGVEEGARGGSGNDGESEGGGLCVGEEEKGNLKQWLRGRYCWRRLDSVVRLFSIRLTLL